MRNSVEKERCLPQGDIKKENRLSKIITSAFYFVKIHSKSNLDLVLYRQYTRIFNESFVCENLEKEENVVFSN